MNRINAVLLAATAMLPLAGAVQAQQNPDTRRPRAEWAGRRTRPHMVDRLLEARTKLNLTDAQVAQLTDIQKKYADLNRPIFERLKASRGDQGERRGMRGDSTSRERFRSMTKEQRSEMRDQMKAKRKEWAEAHPDAVEAHKQLMVNAKAMRKDVFSVLTDKQRAEIKHAMHRHHGHEHGRGRADHPTG